MSRLCFRFLPVAGLVCSAFGALAAQPAQAQSSVISRALGDAFYSARLSDAALSQLRGGYDLAPGVKAYFAFSQLVKLNGEIVQKIVVPQMELSTENSMAQFTITGGTGTQVTSGANPVQLSPSADGTRAAVVNASPATGNLSVATSLNNGQTSISTQFASTGITNHLANTMNNAVVSTATTINLATQGLPAFVQAQRAANMLLNNMQRTQTMSP